MQTGYAAVLAQVIPVIGLALLVEMRQLIVEMRRLERRGAAMGKEAADRRRRVGLSLACLLFLAMAVLTFSEVLCVLAAGDLQLPFFFRLFVLASLFFAVVVTFLLPPAALLWRLYADFARRWLRYATVAVAVIVTIVIVGIIVFLVFVGLFTRPGSQLDFRSGDEPHTIYVPPNCSKAGCGSASTTYEWNLDLRRKPIVTATFVTQPALVFNVQYLAGSLSYEMDGCPDSHVEWSLRIDGGATLATGDLNKKQRSVELHEPISSRDPHKVTISVQRTDDQLCSTVFRWTNWS